MFGGKRYLVLRFYCLLLKVSAGFFLGLTIFAIVQTVISSGSGGQLVTPPARFTDPTPSITPIPLWQLPAAALIALGFISSIGAWALADYLSAHMSIEENTREMVDLMRQQQYSRRVNPVDYPYANASRASSLPRYEDTPLGQYSQRQKGR